MSDPRLKILAWEITRSCNMACLHCRGSARSGPYPDELPTETCLSLMKDVAALGNVVVILTGGEPLLRPDVYEIASFGNSLGLRMTLATCGTLLDTERVRDLKKAGIQRISVSLDGSSAASHDRMRGVPGAFESAMKGIGCLRSEGLPFQINTTVTKANVAEIPAIIEMAVSLGAVAFHPFMLVPTGRGKALADQEIAPGEYEKLLAWFCDISPTLPIQCKPTCAPHYHRIIRQRRPEASAKPGGPRPHESASPPEVSSNRETGPPHLHHAASPPTHGGDLAAMTGGCLGGRSFCFLSHTGEVQICGFLDVSAGNVRERPFEQIWHCSDFLRSIRDVDGYSGRCGVCEFRHVCGGCRARAHAVAGDYLSEEPYCVHQPRNTLPRGRHSDDSRQHTTAK